MNLINQNFEPVIPGPHNIAYELAELGGTVCDNDSGATIGDYNGLDYEGWCVARPISPRAMVEDTYMADELDDAINAFLVACYEHERDAVNA